VSKYYIDKGSHRRNRYEARGREGDYGYSLGSYSTKEEALEAALRDRESNDRYRNVGPGSWDDSFG
jgi:hypothetical protein